MTRFPPELAALRGDAQLAVYVDLKSPYAYIAIDPTRAMARSLGVEIDWRPFTLDIPSYLGSARLAKDGKRVESTDRTPQQWSGVRYAYADARRYAALTGKIVRGTVKIWDSSLAGIAMLWARQRGGLDRFLDVAYPPFWRRELDIEDIGVVEQTVAQAGLETAGFRAWAQGAGRELHDRTNRAAFDAGVYGVPTYLVEDEMWFGREHLPRVAWILGGRRGTAPEVANRSFGEPRPAGARSRLARATLRVALDLRDPLAYLALRPAAAFGRERGIEIDWLPLEGQPLRAPSTPGPDDDRGVRHRRHRARMIAREIAVYAQAQGLTLLEPYRDGSPRAAHLAWLWVRARAPHAVPAFLEELFRRYWALELDGDDLAGVGEVLRARGLDPRELDAWAADEGAREAERVAATLREAGVHQSPAYLLDGEVFHGRQHLPMIGWILDGRVGPGPI